MASKEEKKSKKRKSLAADNAGAMSVSVPESVGLGPAFVNFPSVKPNKATTFTVYSRDPSASTKDITKQQTLIAGETEDVEYFSTNRDRNSSGEGRDCQYLAALFDPKTKTLHVHPTTPLYLLAHRVKRMRTAPMSSQTASVEANMQWKERRNDLGEAFGTRKAKSQIKAEERNKVDVNAMQGVRSSLVASIGGTDGKEEDGVVPPPDVVPVPNLTTDVPSEVYPRQSIIPNNEWSSIDVSPLVKAKDDRERASFLPYRQSQWIQSKIRVAIEGPSSGRKESLRMLFYLSCLLSWYNFANQVSKTPISELPLKQQGIPTQVLDGLVTRFAEPSGKRAQVTDKAKTKLLMWICTCYLAVDGWSVEIGRVAKDLRMPAPKVTDMFKSLGCSVELATPAEREKLGLTAAEASQNRRAKLKAPVKYPKIKRRGPAKH